MTDWDEEDDRPRGVLTPIDREYLRGVSAVEPGSSHERNVRGRIRERSKNGLLDGDLLFARLESRDRQRIFESADDLQFSRSAQKNTERVSDVDSPPLVEGICGWIGLIYLEKEADFSSLIEKAIEDVHTKRGWLAEAEIDIEVTQKRSAKEVLREVQESGEWTRDERRFLLEHMNLAEEPTIDPEKLEEAMGGSSGAHSPYPRYIVPEDISDDEQAIEELNITFRGAKKKATRQAVKAAYDYLRNSGGVIEQDEMADRLEPVYPIPDTPSSAWGGIVGDYLSALPGVETESLEDKTGRQYRLIDTPDDS